MKKSEDRPLTRAELRAELKRYATKDDLDRFATKDDLAREVVRLHGRIDQIGENMATKADIERIVTMIDYLINTTTVSENKLVVHGERLRRLEVHAFGSSPPPPED